MGGLGSLPFGEGPLGGETSGSYSYLNLGQAAAALALRLDDGQQLFYSHQELAAYIVEALRTYNALTAKWLKDFIFTVTGPTAQVWYDLSSRPDYPRLRSVTDSDLYKVMEYHLLEPATGGTWTGSSQFNISDLSQALQRRRDEMLLATSTGMVNVSMPAPINVTQLQFPETVLEVRRMRWVPVSGEPVTLWRDDTLAFQFYSPGYVQGRVAPGQISGPAAYSIVDSSPLNGTIDYAPNAPGSYDLLCITAGAVFDPPEPQIVGIPDDWTWVLKWGALGDVLGAEGEAHDELRAEYARRRYQDGLTAMMDAPWIILAQITNDPCDTPPFTQMDQYAPEWDTNTSQTPSVVVGGVDFIAPIPAPLSSEGLGNKALGEEPLGGFGFTQISVQITVVGNAPVPTSDASLIQVSKDALDVILDYAQHLAAFKQGGEEFSNSFALAKNFVKACMRENDRLDHLGIFRDILLGEFERSEEAAPRYAHSSEDNG